MYEKEEQQLLHLKEQYDQISVPANIDEYIFNGIHNAKVIKKRFFYAKWGSMLAAILIIVLITSIRVSTAFAAYVSEIPGLNKMVELIRSDKGLMSAMKNDFLQEVNVSDEHDGIKVTIDSVIVDEAQMVVFYTIDTDRDYSHLDLKKINLTDENKNDIKIDSISYRPMADIKKHDHVTGNIFFTFNNQAKIPDSFILSAQVEGASAHTWTMPFKIDKQKFAGLKETHTINQTVLMDGQKITFDKMTIYPTRIGIDIRFPAENSMQIFNFVDLRLVDGHGEQWGTNADGLISTGSETEKTYYFQSTYFSKPKELYLEFSAVRALPKDELQVVVDLDNEQVLKTPHDGRIFKVERQGNKVEFFTKIDKQDANYQYGLFSEYSDGNGVKYRAHKKEEYVEGLTQHILVTLEKGHFTDPISFELYDYPAKIVKETRIKIK